MLLLSLIFLVIHHTHFFYGHFGYDDLHYAELAHELTKEKMDFTDHYSYRWPILVMTAISYQIFGISDFSSAIPAILISSGILFLMFGEFRKHPFAMLIAVLLFFMIRWNLFYTDKLMPDIFVSGFVFLAWISYTKFEP